MQDEQNAVAAEVAEAAEQPLPPEFHNWKRRVAMFLTGQTISLFGSSLVQFAIIWYITLTTQSGAMITIATICGFAPQVAVSLFSGVWADRFSRKKLIMGADAMVASATLILAIFMLTGHNDFWLIFMVTAVRSLGSGIQTPAVSAVVPQIVPPNKILRIGGINSSLMSVTFLISPAVSGAILSVAPIESTLFIDVFTAVIGITILATLKIPLHKKALEKQKGGYFDDLKAGVSYVWHSGFLRAFFIYFALFMFFVVPAAQLTPLMVTRTFGDYILKTFGTQEWGLALTEVAFSAGSVAGGVLISIWGGFKNRTRTVALSAILFGILTALLGLAAGFVIFLVFMVLAGVTMPLFNTPAMALLQEQLDPDIQGRVFGLVQIAMTAMMPLGMLVFGPLADVVPIQSLFVVTGIIFAIVGVTTIFNKHFKRGVITD